LILMWEKSRELLAVVSAEPEGSKVGEAVVGAAGHLGGEAVVDILSQRRLAAVVVGVNLLREAEEVEPLERLVVLVDGIVREVQLPLRPTLLLAVTDAAPEHLDVRGRERVEARVALARRGRARGFLDGDGLLTHRLGRAVLGRWDGVDDLAQFLCACEAGVL